MGSVTAWVARAWLLGAVLAGGCADTDNTPAKTTQSLCIGTPMTVRQTNLLAD
jgi:hypothetical protein